MNPETFKVIIKESGFNDIEKSNAFQTVKCFGINEIKSITKQVLKLIKQEDKDSPKTNDNNR